MSVSKKSDTRTQWIRTFEVIEPRKHKNGFTVYKVISKLFPKTYPEGVTVLTVWKRFNDFKALYVELSKIHKQLYLPGKFPPFPIKSKLFGFGRFDFDVVEERRKAGLELLEFSARYTQLFTSKIFNQFFERGYEPSDLLGSISKSDHDHEANSKNDVSGSHPPDPESQRKLTTECLVPEKLWNPAIVNNQSESDSNGGIDSVLGQDLKLDREPSTDADSMLSGSLFNGIDNDETTVVIEGPLQPDPDVFNTKVIDVPNELKNQNVQGIDTVQASEINTQSFNNYTAESISTDSIVKSKDQTDLKTSHPSSSQNLSKRARGLFDFLSNFRTNENKASSDNQFFNSTNGEATYICEAAGHFAVAQSLESDGNLSGAFSSYKEGIRILLTGVKSEIDTKRKVFVRRKLEMYLSRAEVLNQQILGVKPEYQSSTNVHENSSNYLSKTLEPSSLIELKYYKVCRLLDENVYLVFNVEDIPKGLICYIMKVISLSSSPIQKNHGILIPQNIPFMTRIIKWFKTQYSYVLLLEYATGGRLIDFVKRFQSKMNSISPAVDTANDEADREIVLSALEELKVKDEPCASYSKLFEEYSNSNPEVMDFKMVQHLDTSTVVEADGSIHCSLDRFSNTHFVPGSDEVIKTCVNNNHIDSKKFQATSIGALSPSEVGTDELIEISKLLLHDLNHTLQQDKILYENKAKIKSSVKSEQDPGSKLTLSSPKSRTGVSLSLSLENLSISSRLCSSFEKASGASEREYKCEPVQILQMLPECSVKVWAAEMILCLGKLHEMGLTYGNLQMNNILLGENGHILLAFRGLWPEVDDDILSIRNPYIAPELHQLIGETSMQKLHHSCDYWSLGAILFELLVGQTVHMYHPEGFHQNTVIRIPDTNVIGDSISNSAKTLLTELLQVNPSNRLGFFGVEEIKTHPFFECFDWDGALEAEIAKFGHGSVKP